MKRNPNGFSLRSSSVDTSSSLGRNGIIQVPNRSNKPPPTNVRPAPVGGAPRAVDSDDPVGASPPVSGSVTPFAFYPRNTNDYLDTSSDSSGKAVKGGLDYVGLGYGKKLPIFLCCSIFILRNVPLLKFNPSFRPSVWKSSR